MNTATHKSSGTAWLASLVLLVLVVLAVLGRQLAEDDSVRGMAYLGRSAAWWEQDILYWDKITFRYCGYGPPHPEFPDNCLLSLTGLRFGTALPQPGGGGGYLLSGDKAAVPVLLELLDSPDWRIRKHCVRALHIIGQPDGGIVERIRNLAVHDEVFAVRNRAKQALADLLLPTGLVPQSARYDNSLEKISAPPDHDH